MTRRVPVLYNDRDTILHRRDSRAKLVAFGLLVALLYVAPTWEWMLALTGLGLGLAAVARVPPKWLGVLYLLQVPNVLSLMAFTAGEPLLAGKLSVADVFAGTLPPDLQFGLKLALAWSAALFASVALFSTMQVDDIVDGLRGLHVPELVCFTVEYTFLLIYSSLNDVFRIADAMKLKGAHLETRNPIRLARNVPRLTIPAMISVFRRANTMMAVLRMRGFSFHERSRRSLPSKFDAGDASLVAGGLAVFGLVLGARLGVVGLLA